MVFHLHQAPTLTEQEEPLEWMCVYCMYHKDRVGVCGCVHLWMCVYVSVCVRNFANLRGVSLCLL